MPKKSKEAQQLHDYIYHLPTSKDQILVQGKLRTCKSMHLKLTC